jgi:hypothetical protein
LRLDGRGPKIAEPSQVPAGSGKSETMNFRV